MDVTVFVEAPMGSRNKYELDAETGHVVLDRHLATAGGPTSGVLALRVVEQYLGRAAADATARYVEHRRGT